MTRFPAVYQQGDACCRPFFGVLLQFDFSAWFNGRALPDKVFNAGGARPRD